MEKNLKDIIHGRVDIQIGKNGLSEGVVKQIKSQFEKNRYLKIRFLDLHYFETITDAASNLADLTKSKVVDIRGKTCVLQRRSPKI